AFTQTPAASEPPQLIGGSSSELEALIAAHQVAYAALGKAIDAPKAPDREQANQTEEKALLAICAYPAINEEDRRAKATYLLDVEAGGEPDLSAHVQALRRSTIWKA